MITWRALDSPPPLWEESGPTTLSGVALIAGTGGELRRTLHSERGAAWRSQSECSALCARPCVGIRTLSRVCAHRPRRVFRVGNDRLDAQGDRQVFRGTKAVGRTPTCALSLIGPMGIVCRIPSTVGREGRFIHRSSRCRLQCTRAPEPSWYACTVTRPGAPRSRFCASSRASIERLACLLP